MTAKTRAHRFHILASPLWTPFLFPFGVTAKQAFARVDEDSLHVHFGRVFDQEFALEDIESATMARWPIWAGIGPRTDFRGNVGLVGTYVNIVEVRFKQPQRVHLMLVPSSCKKLYLSMEEPHAFIAALGKHITEGHPEAAAKAA